MKKVVCNVCGEVMIWYDDENQWVCPACANGAFMDNGELYYEHGGTSDYDEYYDPEDMSPDKDGFDPDEFE